MRLRPVFSLSLMLMLPGCAVETAGERRADAARLRASVDVHREAYLKVIETENDLARETLTWLGAGGDRIELRHGADRLAKKWAKAFFVLREMHAAMKRDEYRSGTVRETHRQILDRLRTRYVELHDFQRYAQYTSEEVAAGASSERVQPKLTEFRTRLEGRRHAHDEITPILASLTL